MNANKASFVLIVCANYLVMQRKRAAATYSSFTWQVAFGLGNPLQIRERDQQQSEEWGVILAVIIIA